MELANPHPVPAMVGISEIPGYGRRRALAIAKATFVIGDGKADLEMQTPKPMLPVDVPTPLGELPRDDLPPTDSAFEVILLAQARAQGGRPCRRMRVTMAVGTARRELLVTGDRHWETGRATRYPSEPEPFTAMPLTWARAFGGTCAVEIDREAFVDLCDVRNPAGRGWNPAPDAEGLCARLKSPAGYPRFDRTRLLPNVERPESPVTTWDDAPEPACWASVPTASSIHASRAVISGPEGPTIGPGAAQRAHPDWVLPEAPEAGAVVEVRGVTSDGVWAFRLPRIGAYVDLRSNGATDTITLMPKVLVLLPEESRCYLVFKRWADAPPPDGEPRQARLRLDGLWAGGRR